MKFDYLDYYQKKKLLKIKKYVERKKEKNNTIKCHLKQKKIN